MGWMEPGMKVRCIDAEFVVGVESPLIHGAEYILKAVGRGRRDSVPGSRYYGTQEAVWLVGVQNPYASNGRFAAARFRPVQPTKRTTETGMTTLRGILNGQPIREDA